MQHFLATNYRTSINGSIDSLVVTRLVIERSRVRVLAGAFSPGSTFCADSYTGIQFHPCHHVAHKIFQSCCQHAITKLIVLSLQHFGGYLKKHYKRMQSLGITCDMSSESAQKKIVLYKLKVINNNNKWHLA